MNKRQIVFRLSRMYHSFFNLFRRVDKKRLLVCCVGDFHYYHLQPFLVELSSNANFDITLLKWEGFCEKPIQNIRYISKDILNREYFRSYDLCLTTDFGTTPWWFVGIHRIFFHHGVGPKVTYFATKEMEEFDVVMAPGPYIAEKQKQFLKDGTRVFHVGLPATDCFLGDVKITPPESICFLEDKPILLYAPSWSNDINQISMDYQILQKIINQEVCNVIFRPHPNLFKPNRCDGVDWEKTFTEISLGKNNIKVHSGEGTSIYDIIGLADFLMSDMSSVLYEFLIFNRPIILYLKEDTVNYYDCDDYIGETKKACHIINKVEDFNSVLNICIESPLLLSTERTHLLKRSLFNCGSATEKLYQYFIDI